MKHYAQPVRKTLAILLLACIFFSSFGGTLSVLAEEITFLGETMLAGLSNSGYYYSGGNGYQTGGNGYWTSNDGYQTGGDGYWTSGDSVSGCEDGFEYTIVRGRATITGYHGNGGDVVIPSVLGGYCVNSIDEHAFTGRTDFTSITIDNKDLHIDIGDFAFLRCNNLTSIIITGSVGKIGWNAFSGCTNLTVLVLNRVNIIGFYAFYNCSSLTDVYYSGTKAQADAIEVGEDNEALLYATWHYNTCESSHLYSGACDATCNACEWVRSDVTAHSYDNRCDETCNVCGAERTTIHDYADATCTEPATCTICGATKGDALGHSYDTVITEPDCTNSGHTTYTCAACGDSYTDNEVAALGHSWMEATCTASKTCAVCGATEGDALGHSYNAIITEPDCTNGGYTTYTCAACGDSYIDNEVGALGHSWIDATCTNPKKCDVCGEVDGNALGHNWNAATCTTPKTCIACQETEGEALGHTYDNNCDAVCNVADCGYTRTVSDHVYDHACDNDCNICGETRQAGNHVWVGGACDICDAASPSKAVITKVPATAAYAREGAKVSVSIAAEGDGLKYTWYFKNDGKTTYSKSSVNSNTYSTIISDKAKGRRIYCIVADQYGNVVQSKTFILREAVSITKEPSTAAYAKKGTKVSVKLTASGDGLKYTWYFKNVGKTAYSKSSVNTATYSTTLSGAVKGRRVYCVVKDKYGNKVQSKTFILREAVSITTQPKTTTVKKNATAKVTVKASGDGLKYTWYIKNAGSSKYSKSSVTKSTYSVKMTSKVKNRLVYCVVTDKYGKTVKSTTVKLKMK